MSYTTFPEGQKCPLDVKDTIASGIAISALVLSWIGAFFIAAAALPGIESFEFGWRFSLAALLCALFGVCYLILVCGQRQQEGEGELSNFLVGAYARLTAGKPALMVTPGIMQIDRGHHSLTLPDGLRKIDAYTDGNHLAPFHKLDDKSAQLAGHSDLASLQAALQDIDPNFTGMSLVSLCHWQPKSRAYTD